ncbi:sperm flagellar protein 1-like [Cylas formicarius]|uniref:sperm flagellar protein 1-like n=1 Tax=Cylas formicarius TaxID=197179 RepID=UPI0029587262|nr:sperm flagellar protein 1-like [Cylas formicarius]
MDFDLDELYRWIDDHKITRQKRNLNRDFSDALPLAEILKTHFPKLVDLHNYAPRNSLQHKLINWDMINKKVLNKLKINLTSNEQEQLARGKPGAIEKLLMKIKVKIEKSAHKDESSSTKTLFWDGVIDDQTNQGVVPVKIMSGTKTMNQKMVPAEVFDRMELDLTEKDSQIVALKDKVEHLEKMVVVKDERIKDLTQQLQSIINDPAKGDNCISPRARFFNKIF